jgi:hypothetical protein
VPLKLWPHTLARRGTHNDGVCANAQCPNQFRREDTVIDSRKFRPAQDNAPGVDCPSSATNVDVVRLPRPPGGELDSRSSGVSGAHGAMDHRGGQAAGHSKVVRGLPNPPSSEGQPPQHFYPRQRPDLGQRGFLR